MQELLNSVQLTKKRLKNKRDEIKQKKADVNLQKNNLETTQDQLGGEELYKEQLLTETAESEQKFQLLLENAKREQAQIEGEIAALENNAQDKILKIREEIQNRLEDDSEENDELTDEEQFVLDGVVKFTWPTVSQRITCAFHCPGYPYESYFGPHSGMDIGVSSGTAVKAAASGYVTRVYFDGTPNLAWIMIVHGNGLSSVYLHLSSISVAVDQYVKRGDQIGLSGGIPGTPGAGITTGPHLHFEIRVDGIATNPAPYLP